MQLNEYFISDCCTVFWRHLANSNFLLSLSNIYLLNQWSLNQDIWTLLGLMVELLLVNGKVVDKNPLLHSEEPKEQKEVPKTSCSR